MAATQISTLDGSTTTIDEQTLEEFQGRLRGPTVFPADDGFAAATRLWNGMIDAEPALVVQPTGTADVVEAVTFARLHGLALSVKGGGHNLAGTALVDGGLTIDLSRLRGVTVDPAERTATVQPGCVLGDVDRETQLHGLVTPLGFVSETGVAGLTLGGGFGYLTRRFGYTADNLREVEIVTADGAVRRANREQHADLFWAVRGAGHNFGVVTSFVFDLHEVGPTVYGGLIGWPHEQAADVMAGYRELANEADRDLTAFLVLRRAPEAPFVPPEWHGERICAMTVCYSGDVDRADAAVAPIRDLGEPIFDAMREQPYTQLQSYLDATQPKGNHYYWKTEFASDLGDEMLATIRELAGENPIPGGQFVVAHIGGRLNEQAEDDGAVGNRDVAFVYGAAGMWPPDDPNGDGHQQWIRDAWERFREYSTGGNYVNFQTADDETDRVKAAYGDNFDRLVALKARYDPDNLFRVNRNVPPDLADAEDREHPTAP